jgi:hypothetical protein
VLQERCYSTAAFAIVVQRARLILGVNGERESYDLAADPAEHARALAYFN